MEKKELTPEQLEKVTGGEERRRYTENGPGIAVNADGPDARMAREGTPDKSIVKTPNISIPMTNKARKR